MNLQQFSDEGYRTELIRVFTNRENAEMLLSAIGYPMEALPPPGQMGVFWSHVLQELENGIVRDGFESLRQEVATRYPGNQVFPRQHRAARPTTAPDRPDAAPSAIIRITGHRTVREVMDVVHHVQAVNRPPGSVRPGIITDGAVILELSDMNEEQIAEFRQLMETEGRARHLDLHFASASSSFRDYLIGRLYVEGPDQARFELNDVPASTTVRDIARATMEQYDAKAWARDRNGKPRPAVVDHIAPNGDETRLNPDTNLDDNHIGEEASLHVSAESTAGSVNPIVREEALIRARLQIERFAGQNPGFIVSRNADIAPTDYVFKFDAPGWAPPPGRNQSPMPIDHHEVYLALPSEFPMKAPEAFWQTPIFHPNIERTKGFVCLGELADRYRPGMDFGDLCRIFVDIATYRNYTVEEYYDKEAREWAISNEGQAAIEQRGGRSLMRGLLGQIQPPRKLEIKRSDQ